MEAVAAGGQPNADADVGERSGQNGVQQRGAQARLSADGREGARGAEFGSAGMEGRIASLQAEFIQELREMPEMVDQLRRQNPSLHQRLTNPDEQWFSRSAPGTEAFKQDFGRWEVLQRDVELALELFETSRSTELSEQETRDRLNTGPDRRMPEEYRRLVDKYYQSLAEQQPQ